MNDNENKMYSNLADLLNTTLKKISTSISLKSGQKKRHIINI